MLKLGLNRKMSTVHPILIEFHDILMKRKFHLPNECCSDVVQVGGVFIFEPILMAHPYDDFANKATGTHTSSNMTTTLVNACESSCKL